MSRVDPGELEGVYLFNSPPTTCSMISIVIGLARIEFIVHPLRYDSFLNYDRHKSQSLIVHRKQREILGVVEEFSIRQVVCCLSGILGRVHIDVKDLSTSVSPETEDSRYRKEIPLSESNNFLIQSTNWTLTHEEPKLIHASYQRARIFVSATLYTGCIHSSQSYLIQLTIGLRLIKVYTCKMQNDHKSVEQIKVLNHDRSRNSLRFHVPKSHFARVSPQSYKEPHFPAHHLRNKVHTAGLIKKSPILSNSALRTGSSNRHPRATSRSRLAVVPIQR